MVDDRDINHRIPSLRTPEPRQLSNEELLKLEKQNLRIVTPFLANKLEVDARKNWDQFYKRNKTNFFKDRHWTTSEFTELLGSKSPKRLLEIGCGVGNLVFPLLEENTFSHIFACDFSPRAIDFVKENPLHDPDKITAFVADVTEADFKKHLRGEEIDVITLVFVLSAVHPDKLVQSVRNIFECVKPGGVVLVRDYAVNDMTQIRFKPGNKISDNFYMRHDGTRTYFFTVELAEQIFTRSGFQIIECCYVHCRTINKKEQVDAPRTFIQGKFMRPS